MSEESRTLHALGADTERLESLGASEQVRELICLWMTAWGGITMVPILSLWTGLHKDVISRAIRPLREARKLLWYDSRHGQQREHLGRRAGVMELSPEVVHEVHSLHPRTAASPYFGMRESWRNDIATQWTAMRVIDVLGVPMRRMLPHQRQLSGLDKKHPDTILETRDGFRLAIDAEASAKSYEAIEIMCDGLICGLQDRQFDAVVVSLAPHFSRSVVREYMTPFQAHARQGIEACIASRVFFMPLDLGVSLGERG